MELFPPWPAFTAFLMASFVLAITPGPGVLYIVTRSVVQGRRHGVISVAGIALGNLGNVLLAAVGVAAVLSLSSLAFSIVKYTGAIYLIYLGTQMLRASPTINSITASASAPLGRVFRDGFIVALFNPKTTLFFGAFLPQFLSANTSTMGQSLALGSLFVAIAAATDSLYVMAAGLFAATLQNRRHIRIGHCLGGGVFICLGLFTALAGVRSGK